MYFHPLKFRRLHADDFSGNLLEDPLRRHGKDIVEHLAAILNTSLKGDSGEEAYKLRIELQQPHISASPNANTYGELSETLPPLMEHLRTHIYGGSFRKAMLKPAYSRELFDDSVLLIKRELEKLRLAEGLATNGAYVAHELFLDFFKVYEGDQLNSFLYSPTQALKLDPNRPYFIRMAILRDAVFLERTYSAKRRLLELILEAPLLSGKSGAEELKNRARTLQEEWEVEELWERIARS